MPYNCCVPQCSSTTKVKNIMFHKFPEDTNLKQKWCIAIKSGKNPSRHSKVCSKHFNASDYTVTSMGQWKIPNKSSVPHLCLPVRRHDAILKHSNRDERTKLRIKKMSETSGKTENNNDESKSQLEVNEIFAKNSNSNENSTQTENMTVTVGLQTINSMRRSQLVSFSFLSDSQIKHFSGFDREGFSVLCNFFGTLTNNNSALCVEDEILVTLIKLRQNLYYRTIAVLFDVDQRVVTRIFNFWINHLYDKLKTINFWALKVKRSDNDYDVVIDCTEIIIEKSNDPIVQQATYSTYKSSNTFKVLVGCTEYGFVTYVSDAYGGSVSDRKIVELSGFLDVLNEGDYVLADRGFDISDLLESKKVHLNIPPFKRGTQLTEYEVAKTRAIANRRIIIEQLNGLAKKNKILVHRMPAYLWPHIVTILIKAGLSTSK